MNNTGEPTQRARRKRDYNWGKLILDLRLKKGLTRSSLITRCHRKMSEMNPDYEDKDVPNEAWLARVERGEGVTFTRQNIELLCAALDATPRQLWEILFAAELNVFGGPNSEATPESKALSFAYLTLMSSPYVRRAVRKYLRDHQDPIESE